MSKKNCRFYPIYIHKEQDSCYGITFPDVPGCFAAADALTAIPAAVKEAFEAHFGTGKGPIPKPTTPEDWGGSPNFAGGYWDRVQLAL